MTRRTRLTSTVLSLALLLAVLPASAGSAQSGTPLRPAVRDQADPSPSVVLRGSGWGHSVGMSQYGAYAASRAGRSHDQILSHYYPGTSTRRESIGWVTVTLADGAFSSTTVRAMGGDVPWTMGSMAADQPEGATWTVRRREIDGAYWLEVLDADDRQVQITQRAVSVELPQASGSGRPGTYIQAYNPNGSGSELCNPGGDRPKHCYGYGITEFTLEAASGSTTRDRIVMRQRLTMESYLRGLGEVPSSWGGASGGQEALEAQAIIARTYAMASGRTLCATASCQVFIGLVKELEPTGGNWVAAVRDPADKVMRYGDGYAQTFYSSSHGGRTEASQDSWAYGGAVPYLTSVDDPWSLDASNPMRSWTAVATNSEFRRVTGLGLSRIERVQITSRTAGGSPRTLVVTGPEGAREFSTTAPAARSRSCNREGYAGNSLRCDLSTTVRNAAGTPFAGAGGKPPSSQIRSIGFGPFTDDDGNTHEYATVWAHEAGIAQGTTATTFKPRSGVTRAQMASFIYRTFDVPARSDSGFEDVGPGPHAEAIASVAAAGIAKGYDSRRFGPTDRVTREQMASFIARAMGLAPVRPEFRDVSPSGTHAGNVGAIAERGITAGCGGDRYCPQDTVTRDQMTTFLHRAVRSLR